MKIAIVGKGGSGKSTLSWLLVRRLESLGRSVLAIDADYNMDLAANLGINLSDSWPYINHSEKDFYTYQHLSTTDYYVDLVLQNLKPFRLQPPDEYTQKYALKINSKLSLMVSGSYHEDLLYGHRCSHAYITPLKFYLPLLQSQECFVVVDAVAGIDMVGYGLFLGTDALVIATEDTANSQKVNQQISQIATELGIPAFTVHNKAENSTSILSGPDLPPVIGHLGWDKSLLECDYQSLNPILINQIDEILFNLNTQLQPSDSLVRFILWKQKYEFQKSLNAKDPFQFYK